MAAGAASNGGMETPVKSRTLSAGANGEVVEAAAAGKPRATSSSSKRQIDGDGTTAKATTAAVTVVAAAAGTGLLVVGNCRTVPRCESKSNGSINSSSGGGGGGGVANGVQQNNGTRAATTLVAGLAGAKKVASCASLSTCSRDSTLEVTEFI